MLIGLATGISACWVWQKCQTTDQEPPSISHNTTERPDASIQSTYQEHITLQDVEQANTPLQRGLSILKLIANCEPSEYPELWDNANQLGKYRRRDLRSALLQEWASQTPHSALDFLMRQSNGFNPESMLVYQLYEGWALKDANEAFENVSSQLSKSNQKTAYQAILDITARHDPYRAAELYQQLARDDYKVMCQVIGQEMAARSPSDAIQFVEEMPNGHHRNSMLLRIAQAISIDDPNKAVDLTSQISHLGERNKALSIILGRVAVNNPQQAFQVYQNLAPELQDDSHLYPIIGEWAKQDIHATLDYFDNRDLSSAEWLLLRHAYNTWSNTRGSDRQIILQSALELGNSTKAIDIQVRCIHAQIGSDINQAKYLIESLDPGPLQEQARRKLILYLPRKHGNDATIEYAQSTEDPTLLKDAVTAIANSMMYENPEAGAEYFKTKDLNDPNLNTQGLTRIMDHWTKEAPQAAIPWIANQEDLANYDAILNRSLRVSSGIDPRWTAEVLETLNTSEETEKLIHAQIAHQWALNNPQAALDWAVQQERNREDSIRAIARIWSENDPEAATAALEKANVKP
ncbi:MULTISPECIES: hypothetical protein [unclassified Lentimonas]|uniref:hypothetical protein n=1 Tax=unclassified Lentimonas TaxID=2630993 RepID=UPI001389EBE9|nr:MULTISPECIES: hypothetical protein [unclassified Lentimonas]